MGYRKVLLLILSKKNVVCKLELLYWRHSGECGTLLKSWTCNDQNVALTFYDSNQLLEACREVQDLIRRARCIMWLSGRSKKERSLLPQ